MTRERERCSGSGKMQDGSLTMEGTQHEDDSDSGDVVARGGKFCHFGAPDRWNLKIIPFSIHHH